MAYRRDITDPLEVIIQQRRAQRQVIVWFVLCWLGSMAVRALFSLNHTYIPAVQAAPPQPPAVQTRASGGTQTMVTADGKMSAFALERWLSTAPSSGQTPQDVRCRRALSGWDYICSYATPGPTPTRFKIGVRVSANSVLEASAAHKYESELPPPSGSR